MKTKKNSIKDPRITEKATSMSENNVYTFNVATSATKKEIEKSIFSMYKIKPLKINVLSIPKKNVYLKGKKNSKGGGKKAVVYLKKGDKIEFI